MVRIVRPFVSFGSFLFFTFFVAPSFSPYVTHPRLFFSLLATSLRRQNSVFLWVNLGAPDSPNEFLDDARMVTWFGGSRTHDGSPAIRELLRRGRRREGRPGGGGGGGEGGGISDVVLWCRRYRPEARAFTPYVCFGRMGYRSHKPGSRPLAFVWDLLDYDGLRFHPDPVVREMFDLFTKR